MFEQHPEYAGTTNEVLLKLAGQTFYDRRFKDGPPKGQATNPDNTLTFKETGHAIGGKFRAYWEKHGGLAQQGYPMTDEFKMASTDGKEYTTQIFQRAVFELHPEFAGSENEVLLRLLGVEELEELNKPPEPPVIKDPTPEASLGTKTLDGTYKAGRVSSFVQQNGSSILENNRNNISASLNAFYDIRDFSGDLDYEVISLPTGALDGSGGERFYNNGKLIRPGSIADTHGVTVSWYSTDAEEIMLNDRKVKRVYFSTAGVITSENMNRLRSIQNTIDAFSINYGVGLDIVMRFGNVANINELISIVQVHPELKALFGSVNGKIDPNSVPYKLIPPPNL